MSAMEIDNDIANVFAVLRQECDPELTGVFYEMEDLYERKLWHQLTIKLEQDFYKNPLSEGYRLRIYDRFVTMFESKINPLKLIQFALWSLTEIDTVEEKLSYLQNLKDQFTQVQDSQSNKHLNIQTVSQAIIFVSSEIANIKLEFVNNLELDEIKSIIDDVQLKIDSLNTIDNRINASFYKLLSKYYKVQFDYTRFYKTSLLYLACISDVQELLILELDNLVYDISISALLGDKIYNFGELIMHPIFDQLKISWLKELILSLNSGNLNEFTKQLELIDNKLIVDHKSFLKQKICIMTLIELIFTKPSNKKMLKFQEILSHVTLLSNINEVEYLIMKCLSLGLVKGFINQVDQELEISWVQPRVMNKEQIEIMKSKLVDWNSTVVNLTQYMDTNGKQVWV